MYIRIVLVGCDDETNIEMDVTEEQLKFLELLSEKSEEISEFNCMPIMKLYTYPEDEPMG